MPPSDLPEAATERLGHGAWSSALSVPDFASTLALGLEPVGFVQGYCVMQWSWYQQGTTAPFLGGYGQPVANAGSYSEVYRCPHGMVSAEHRTFGYNWEQDWLETSWAQGWGLAYQRMMEEAEASGAHGVIGVLDAAAPLAGSSTIEYSIRGTAVVVPDSPRPSRIFSTFLSGARLAKLIEAGYTPVSVVAAMSSVQMIGYCITRYQMSGQANMGWLGSVAGVASIAQVGKAQSAARHLARAKVRAQLGSDSLHGAHLDQSTREFGEGDMAIQCVIKGTRVRRFKDFNPLPHPTTVVPLR